MMPERNDGDANPEDEKPQWNVTLINERAGYVLEDAQGTSKGYVFQDILRRGEWCFSNKNHVAKGGFKSSDDAKRACEIDLSL